MKASKTKSATVRFSLLALLIAIPGMLPAAIDGVAPYPVSDGTGIFTGYILTPAPGYITTPDGNAIFVWGISNFLSPMQYTAPTLIVDQGQTITILLINDFLSVPVSLVFPGMGAVTTADPDPLSGLTSPGDLTLEALPSPGFPALGGIVRYQFTASQPGTYHYHSGTDAAVQVEMGMVGAIIVRPAGFNPLNPSTRRAYTPLDTVYDDEFLFLLTEMDPRIHRQVELGLPADTNDFFPVQWLINGRCGPDTLFPPNAAYYPNQPYNCLPAMYPGEKVLMRVIGGGRDLHPFHHHGNHSRVIARDGRLLKEAASLATNLAQQVFTISIAPGQTWDATFEWTGAKLGWDIYGHATTDPLQPNEYAPDHGKPLPVILPDLLDLTFGGFWSGSPFLGASAALPPGEGGLNPWSGYTFMWHSHTEKEITNNDIFPGGMMTMLLVVPPGTPKP